jgi:hypothetical protein
MLGEASPGRQSVSYLIGRETLVASRAAVTVTASATLKMEANRRPLALISLLILSLLRASSAATVTTGAPDGSQLWGYVEVRPSNWHACIIPPDDRCLPLEF